MNINGMCWQLTAVLSMGLHSSCVSSLHMYMYVEENDGNAFPAAAVSLV